MATEYLNNLLIYYNNLSNYYIVSVVISVLAVLFSWIIHFKRASVNVDVPPITNLPETNITGKSGIVDEPDIEDIINKLKNCKTNPIEDITDSLTDEQIAAEKEVERQQLAAILELLKKQEDKFQVGSMEELEGQLKLYR